MMLTSKLGKMKSDTRKYTNKIGIRENQKIEGRDRKGDKETIWI